MSELYHYGVKGMKWGVRRARNKKSLINKVSKTHKFKDDVERYQGRANTALQAAKGHQLLSTKARNTGDKNSERVHNRKSVRLLSESETYERMSEKAMSNFLKSKASALYGSAKVKDGKRYVDSLVGLTISKDNVNKYETRYGQNRRYAEGYKTERQHVEDLTRKYK